MCIRDRYTAKTGGSKVTSLKVTKNVTLYAHWQKNAPATIKVQRIELNTDGFSVEVGKTYQVKAKVYPENATNKKIKWVTYGDRITVSDTGLVTGRKEGMTSVTDVYKRQVPFCQPVPFLYPLFFAEYVYLLH